MTQGEIIAQEMNLDHNCSVGWLDGFKKRHDLHFKKSHGEKKSADTEAVKVWVEVARLAFHVGQRKKLHLQL